MSREVLIKQSSLQPRSPILAAIVYWLLLDRFNAPGWAFGAYWTLVVLLVVIFFYRLRRAELRDVPGFGEK